MKGSWARSHHPAALDASIHQQPLSIMFEHSSQVPAGPWIVTCRIWLGHKFAHMLRLVLSFTSHGSSILHAQLWNRGSNPCPRQEVIPVLFFQPCDAGWGARTPKGSVFAQVSLGFLCRHGASSYPVTVLLFASLFLTFQSGSAPKLVSGILAMGCPILLSCEWREAEGWLWFDTGIETSLLMRDLPPQPR